MPFTDAQIEKMARAAHRRMRDEGRTTPWKELPLFAKDAWRHGIRAALAAGGLESCPVPRTGNPMTWRCLIQDQNQAAELTKLYHLRRAMQANGRRCNLNSRR